MTVNTKNCPLCKKQIKVDEDIAILSYPLRVTGTNGEYSFVDFIKNEVQIHFNCLRINGKNLPLNEQKKAIYESLKEIIKQLGEKKIDTESLLDIVYGSENPNIASMIKTYFQNKADQTSLV